MKLLLSQTANELTTKQKQQLQQCLGTTPEDADTAGDGADFGEDLERLFAEDGDEDYTG